MPMTKAERLKVLEEKQEQIRAQIQALRARDVAQERKNETRRKILLGGLILKMVKEGDLDAKPRKIGFLLKTAS